MAGTPTQYYGFPTYADSDAVDLTAQYNTAVTNIDSELHQLDVQVTGPRKPKIAILGDSWVDPNYAYGKAITARMEQNIPGITIYDYGVSSARLSTNIPSQCSKLIAEHSGENLDAVFFIAGINDFHNNDNDFTATSNNMESMVSSLMETFPTCPVHFVLDYPAYINGNAEVTNFYTNFIENIDNIAVPFDDGLLFIMDSSSFVSGDYHPNTTVGCIQVADYLCALVTGTEIKFSKKADITDEAHTVTGHMEFTGTSSRPRLEVGIAATGDGTMYGTYNEPTTTSNAREALSYILGRFPGFTALLGLPTNYGYINVSRPNSNVSFTSSGFTSNVQRSAYIAC